MKAFLIDPTTETVTETTYNGNIDDIYNQIDAQNFDVATINKEWDGVYVDGEGLFSDERFVFTVTGYPEPLVNTAMVIGCNSETGESRDPSVTLEWLQSNVNFMGRV